MDSDSHQRHTLFGRALDVGVSTSLLVAIAAVFAVDRAKPKPFETPKSVAVDLVFVLDGGPAMEDFVESMKANCLEKATGLQGAIRDCRFAVVPFGDGERLVPEIPLTDDLDTFRRLFMAEPDDGGASPAASSVEALQLALRMDFRQDANVFFFLITNTPRQPGHAIAGIAGQMNARGIKAVIQAPADEQDFYQSLYEQGGRFFSLEGQDLTGSIASTRDAGDSSSQVALSLLAPTNSGVKADRDPAITIAAKGLYALRTETRRDKWISQLGGSPMSEQAVRDGLVWLARHQADDGHWSDAGKCEHAGACPEFVYSDGRPIAETGMALLAFQAGGHYYFNDRKYSDHVSRGLNWLVQQQGGDGGFFATSQSGGHDSWYQHGIATFAVAEACAVARAEERDPDARYLEAATRAVKFMEIHQYARGGWQYALDSQDCGDTSVTGWQVLALKSAMEAKIDVGPPTMRRIQQFYEACGNPHTGQTSYSIGQGSGTDLTTAVGLIVQQFILKQPDSPLAQKAIEYLKARAEVLGTSGDFYTLYNATLAMFLAGGGAWDHWNRHVRDAVLARQVKEGCARGSWPGDPYGRTLSTAWAVLTLEVYYRYAHTASR